MPTAATADRAVVDLGGAEVTVTVTSGPRVLAYRSGGIEAPFAALPDASIEHPAVGRFRFVGGHRLWRAPEDPPVTYRPDESGAGMDAGGGGVTLTSAADGDGVVKEIVIHQRRGATVVDHVLRNTGPAPVTAAPWAITQLAVGGTALLPQATEPADADGVAANRWLVLWPYTDLAAPEIVHRRGRIEVTASAAAARCKIGWPNRRGWLGYRLGDVLFVKWAPTYEGAAVYADAGASAQCYRDERFIELETMGPLTEIAPGDAATHREVWTLLDLAGGDLEAVIESLPTVHPELAP